MTSFVLNLPIQYQRYECTMHNEKCDFVYCIILLYNRHLYGKFVLSTEQEIFCKQVNLHEIFIKGRDIFTVGYITFLRKIWNKVDEMTCGNEIYKTIFRSSGLRRKSYKNKRTYEIHKRRAATLI